MRRFPFEILLLVSFPFEIVAQNPYISPDLLSADPNSNVNVIVQFAASPAAASNLATSAVVRRVLPTINSVSYSIPAGNIQALAATPNVVSIVPDRPVHMLLDNTAAAVNAAAAWSWGLDGTGIGIAVIDSGISAHDDLQNSIGSRVVYSANFVGTDAADHYGHGEHVSGILAGNGTDSQCWYCSRHFVGIAPNANLIDLRVLDENGAGMDSAVIAAIQTAIQLKSQYNIRVINLSLGRPVYETYQFDPLCQAVEAAWQAGIVVVAAAGNDGRNNSANNNGYGTIGSPANDPYVITVGAMKSMGTPNRSDDLIASYSSKGPTLIDHIVKPDLVAPGNLVVSLLLPGSTLQSLFPQDSVPLNYYEFTSESQPSNFYFTLSGTSMAAPVVSGAAALLLQLNPWLTPDQVKAKLMLTAYKQFPETSTATDPVSGQTFTSEYDIFTVGAGYLDIQAAINDSTVFWGTAQSPVAVYSPSPSGSGGVANVVCGFSTICSGSVLASGRQLWTLVSIWGSQSIAPDQSIWGDQSVWGDQSIWGDQSVWGDQSIWGDLSTWGNTSSALSIMANGEPN